MLVPSWEDEKMNGTFQWRSTRIFSVNSWRPDKKTLAIRVADGLFF